MLKKMVNIMVVMVLAAVVSVPCYAKGVETKTFENSTEENSISPRIVVAYERSIKIAYPALSTGSIPQTYYYSEWSEKYDTQCSGLLRMTHSVTLGTVIRVTYEGKISGTI
ncbi:MAG: hypothetical protein HFI16_00700 [Lachnospiraceae bacterium]|nr:hypothetical protein [Lachnospiraceae bacterium]